MAAAGRRSTKVIRDLALGLALTVLVWFLLESSFTFWFETTQRGLPDSVLPAIISLIGVGLLVGLVSLLPVSPLVTAIPVLVLLAVLAPFYLAGAGLDVWWPEAWPGSPYRLGSASGTYMAIGVLAGITVFRFQATRQRRALERDRSHRASGRLTMMLIGSLILALHGTSTGARLRRRQTVRR
jgi:hypothetical protein